MKELQNNFTTSEQSKRLLELGVPADSADCFYRNWDCLLEHPSTDTSKYIHVRKTRIEQEACYMRFAGNLPCWSVGRLIEIYELCSGKKYERKSARLVKEGNVSVMKEITIIEDVIGDIINARLYIYPHIDFSKLEN